MIWYPKENRKEKVFQLCTIFTELIVHPMLIYFWTISALMEVQKKKYAASIRLEVFNLEACLHSTFVLLAWFVNIIGPSWIHTKRRTLRCVWMLFINSYMIISCCIFIKFPCNLVQRILNKFNFRISITQFLHVAYVGLVRTTSL